MGRLGREAAEGFQSPEKVITACKNQLCTACQGTCTAQVRCRLSAQHTHGRDVNTHCLPLCTLTTPNHQTHKENLLKFNHRHPNCSYTPSTQGARLTEGWGAPHCILAALTLPVGFECPPRVEAWPSPSSDHFI